MSSITALILVLFLRNFPGFFTEAHQTNSRPPFNQDPLIPTYFSPSSSSSSLVNSPPTSAQKHSTQQSAASSTHYLAYHPNPSFYHQNVYLTSPPGSPGASNQPSGISTSYSYGFGGPGATNLYTYGTAAAGNSPLMLASGSSTQAVMTTVPINHQESKMLATSEQIMSSGQPNSDKNSKSPLGIVFGRPMSGYDGNYYVPVFYPLAWLGLNSGTTSAASTSSADPMAAFPSTASPSSLPAPFTPTAFHHHHHPRPFYNFHHPSPIFSYPSQFQTGLIPTASKLPTTTNQPMYRIMVPVHQPSPSAIYRSPAYHQMISTSSSSPSGLQSSKPVDEMMPGDVTPDLNGNFKRAGAHNHILHHHQHHHPNLHQNPTPMDDGDDAGSYFFGDPTPLMRGTGYSNQPETGGSSSSSLSNMATAESSSSPQQSYYYIAPVIKYRDPKDDYNLAIEASKEQISAQKRFEKEVLMAEDDELHPGSPSSSSEQSFLTIEEQPTNNNNQQEPSSQSYSPYLNPRSGVTSNGSTDYAKIESRSSSDTQPTANDKKSPKTSNSEPPILTSIEIFDLPGANKYLGLDHSPKSQTNEAGGTLPMSQIARPNMLLTNQTETTASEKPPRSSSLALPASKFYRRKLSTTVAAKAESSKTVK